MNQLQGVQSQQAGNQNAGRNVQPASIQVNIEVNMQQNNIKLSIQIDPEIPFSEFVGFIKQQIFAQRMQAQYEDTIEYQLPGGGNITQTEGRTLNQLGFTNACTLVVRLKLKGGL